MMADAPDNTALTAVKDDPLIDLLMQEYSILQDKMDKIGGFRFMIKGWALTLNTGTLVAASATSLTPWPAFFLVLLLLFALWTLEYRQLKLSDIFQDRALRIENSIGRRLEEHGLRRIDFLALRRIPGIANELRNPFDQRRPDRVATSSLSNKSALSSKLSNLPAVAAIRRWSKRRRVVQSDLLFYVLLLIVSSVFIYFQRAKADSDKRGSTFGHYLRTSGAEDHRLGSVDAKN